MNEKAYKLVAAQEGISNSKAKDLIDKGLVTVGNKKVNIARGELPADTKFKVKEIQKCRVIFENDEIMAVDKPPFLNSFEISRMYPKAILLNRLDAQTSGVMLFAKTEEFQKKAINAFKNLEVYKEYSAIVEGKVLEEIVIDTPISTIKGDKAHSKVDKKHGKPAITKVYADMINGTKSKVKVVIEHGRTHQIRVHLKSVGLPILGDDTYGRSSTKISRMLLHCKVTKIFGYEFQSKNPKEYRTFGF